MKRIDEDLELRRVMKSIRLESPGNDFSMKVMAGVLAEAEKRPVFTTEPILGKRFWIFVLLFVAVAAVALIVAGSGAPVGNSAEITAAEGLLDKLPSPDLTQVEGIYEKMLNLIGSLPLTFAGILLSASLLVVLDKFLNSRHKYQNSLA